MGSHFGSAQLTMLQRSRLIGAATFLETFAGFLDGASILAHCRKQHAAEAYAKYLAEPESRAWLGLVQPGEAPVGYSLLTAPDLPLDDLTDDDIELKRIYLFSRFQGNGRGQTLLEGPLNAARYMGRTSPSCWASTPRTPRRSPSIASMASRRSARAPSRWGATLCHDLILGPRALSPRATYQSPQARLT